MNGSRMGGHSRKHCPYVTKYAQSHAKRSKTAPPNGPGFFNAFKNN